jgi:putative sigma-54 modulation protein
MEITIKTKNLELTEAIENYVNEKIGSLEKFINVSPSEISVEIEKETNHHRKGPFFKAEAKIDLPGKTLISVSQKDDLLQAIVEVKDELQQEIKKYKAKTQELEIRQQRQQKI